MRSGKLFSKFINKIEYLGFAGVSTRFSFIAVFFAFTILTLLTSKFFDEDSLIILRYVKNLVINGNFAFNISNPTYSITCPLWGIILSIPNYFLDDFNNYRLVSTIFSLVIGYLLLAVVYLYAKLEFVQYPMLPVLLLALDPYLIWCCSNANEMACYIIFLILSFYFYKKETNNKHLFFSSVFAGLAFLVRPEAILLFVLIPFMLITDKRENLKRTLLTHFIGFFLVILPWFVFAKIYYGSFIPLTISAKAAPPGYSWFHTFKFFSVNLIKTYLIEIVFLFTALFYINNFKEKFYKNRMEILLIGGTLSLYLFKLREASIPNRYILVFSPFLIILSCKALHFIYRRINDSKISKDFFIGILICFLLTINIGFYISRANRNKSYMKYIDVCKWVKSNLPADSKIFSGMIGAPAYFTDNYIVDDGIITPSAIPYRKKEISLEELLQNEKVEYVLTIKGGLNKEYLEMVYSSSGKLPIKSSDFVLAKISFVKLQDFKKKNIK
ncbi:MAG: glycosyltransferase family 39 protein [archaeon]|nr:glycosyltransferase family 39 protein [archaeon]